MLDGIEFSEFDELITKMNPPFCTIIHILNDTMYMATNLTN